MSLPADQQNAVERLTKLHASESEDGGPREHVAQLHNDIGLLLDALTAQTQRAEEAEREQLRRMKLAETLVGGALGSEYVNDFDACIAFGVRLRDECHEAKKDRVRMQRERDAALTRAEEAERAPERAEALRWLRSCTPAEREAAAFYADLESFRRDNDTLRAERDRYKTALQELDRLLDEGHECAAAEDDGMARTDPKDCYRCHLDDALSPEPPR